MQPIEVILPTRNAPQVLWLTLTHYWAHAHDSGAVRAITLLDNRSTAEGMDLVLGEALRRGCRVVRHEQNLGVWASVNRGLALARSPWVLVLTSDVLLGPGAVTILAQLLAQAPPEVVMLGPEVHDTLEATPLLARLPLEGHVDVSRYNGACWLMRWDVLRERVGWFDPQFCVCYGDTDYVERLRQAGLLCGIITQLPCVHLDKQSRRGDHTVEEDTEVEIRDGARFHDKWAEHPDVLARHPQVDRQAYLDAKAGWKERIVA